MGTQNTHRPASLFLRAKQVNAHQQATCKWRRLLRLHRHVESVLRRPLNYLQLKGGIWRQIAVLWIEHDACHW